MLLKWHTQGTGLSRKLTLLPSLISLLYKHTHTDAQTCRTITINHWLKTFPLSASENLAELKCIYPGLKDEKKLKRREEMLKVLKAESSSPPSEIFIFRSWRINSLRPFKLSVSINRTWLLYKMFKHVAEKCFSQAASWIRRDPASFFLSSFLVLERVLSSLFNFPTVCLCFGGNVKTLSSSLVFTGN